MQFEWDKNIAKINVENTEYIREADIIRIISARKTTNNEKKQYEDRRD